MYSLWEKKKFLVELKIIVMEKIYKRLKGVENWESVFFLCLFVNKEFFRFLV